MTQPPTPLRRATATATLLALLAAPPVMARGLADASAPRGPTPAPSAPASPANQQAQDEGSVPCKVLNMLAQGDFGGSSFFAAPASPAPKGVAPAATEPKPCLVLRGLA
jgi:hypothetical protein